MRNDVFKEIVLAKEALLAAESEHPESRALKVLHERMARGVEALKSILTDDQYAALGGGTGKTGPGDPGDPGNDNN